MNLALGGFGALLIGLASTGALGETGAAAAVFAVGVLQVIIALIAECM